MKGEMTPRVEDLLEFFYHASTALVQTDLSGKITLLNPIAVQLLMPIAQRGDLLDNLFATLDRAAPEIRTMVALAPARAGRVIYRHRIELPSGTRGRTGLVCLELSMVRLSDSSLITIIEDVSESARRERLLAQEEAWINAMFSGARPHAYIVLDSEGKIASWDAEIEQLTGFDNVQMLGQFYTRLFTADGITAERLYDRLAEVDRNGLSIAEGPVMRGDGNHIWGHSVITRAAPQAGNYLLLLRDMSAHRETVESLLKAASSDPLTGVGNRRALVEAAELEFARHARSPRDISLLLLDIDHFKQINDRYGHPAGDQVIRNLASVMMDSLRTVDVVSRFGGEEFAALLPSASTEVAVQIAERIRKSVAAQAVGSSEGVIRYRVSIGVASVTPAISDLSGLILAADQALYQAKRQGRDRVCVPPT